MQYSRSIKSPKISSLEKRSRMNGVQKESDAAISRLPNELILEILALITDPTDRLSCGSVSKRWLHLQVLLLCQRRLDLTTLPFEPSRATRYLDEPLAADTRLAAMAVARIKTGRIEKICICEDPADQAAGGSAGQPMRLSPLTDRGLSVVGSSVHYLKSLALWGCSHITNKGLEAISSGCSLLRKLDLCQCPLIKDEGMEDIAKGMKSLVSLSLDSCPKLGNGTLVAFKSHTPTIESLHIRKCPLVTIEGIVDAIARGLPQLKELKLESNCLKDCTILAAKMHPLSTLTRIIGLVGTAAEAINGEVGVVNALQPNELGFGRLMSLLVSKCDLLDDMGLVWLSQGRPGLKKLSLEDCNGISFCGLSDFLCTSAQNLQLLSLVRCQGIVQQPLLMAANSSLNSSSVSSDHHPTCTMLKKLVIKQCVGLGDTFLKWIGAVTTNLHELEIIGMRTVTDNGVVSLLQSSAAPLERVSLSGCKLITDLSIRRLAISDGAKLRSVSLDGCTGLTDMSLPWIAGSCKSLEDLDLSGCGFTDGGLVWLEYLVGLSGLNLKNCPKLSKKAVEALEVILVGCDLIF